MIISTKSNVLSVKEVAERKAKCEAKEICYISLKPFNNEADVVEVDGFKVRAIYA
jgi:hypothetical protein